MKNNLYIILLVAILLICTNYMLVIYGVTQKYALYVAPLQVIIFCVFLYRSVTLSNTNTPTIIRKVRVAVIIFLIYIFVQDVLFVHQNEVLIKNLIYSCFSMCLLLFSSNIFISRKNNMAIIRICTFFFVSFFILFIISRLHGPVVQDEEWDEFFLPQYYNSIYYLLFLLPFLFRNKTYALASTIIFIVALLISDKQGALIGLFLGILAYLYSNQKLSEKTSSLKIPFLICIAFAIFYIIYSYVVETLNYNIFSQFSNEEVGSGRTDIYISLLTKLWDESSVLKILFGHGGLNSVSRVLSISAHNDFLEVLFDFGLIGLILYIRMLWYIYRLYRYSVLIKYEYAPAFAFSIASFIFISCVSHLIFIEKYCMLIMLFWGLCVSEISKRLKHESSYL